MKTVEKEMKMDLAYAQFGFRGTAVTYLGRKDAIRDMQNYLDIHFPDDLTMAAMIDRVNRNELYVFVTKIDKFADAKALRVLKREFKTRTGRLIDERAFKVAMAFLEEEKIARPNGFSHQDIVEFIETSMWRDYIIEYEDEDLLPDPDDEPDSDGK